MKTQNDSIAEATAPVSSTAKMFQVVQTTTRRKLFGGLLVDNLHHIFDHGIKTAFVAGTPVARALDYIRAQSSGSFELKSGKSTATVIRLGRITRVTAFFAVGNNHRDSLHYHDDSAAPALSFTITRNSQGPHSNDPTFDLLLSQLLEGCKIPDFFRPGNGAEADAVRYWSESYAWALAGEAGMRAKALKSNADLRAKPLQEANANCYHAGVNLRRARKSTPELFQKDREFHREKYLREAEGRKQLVESLTSARAGIDNLPMIELKQLATQHGGAYRIDWNYQNPNLPLRCVIGWAAESDAWSYPDITSNYTATCKDGEIISLSSGIVCPISVSEIKTWLAGSEAPRTQYGSLGLLLCRNKEGQPRTLISCGCHRIDPLLDLPELFKDYIPNSHAVTRTPGRAELRLLDENRPGIIARIVEEIEKKLKSSEIERVQSITEYTRDRSSSLAEEAALPTRLAEFETALAVAEVRVEAETATLAAAKTQTGATLEQLTRNACIIFDAMRPRAVTKEIAP